MFKFITSVEFVTGVFVSFVLTSLICAVIITEGFVAKKFLQQNNIYLDGKIYKLCTKKVTE